jgi:hypothetical protein
MCASSSPVGSAWLRVAGPAGWAAGPPAAPASPARQLVAPSSGCSASGIRLFAEVDAGRVALEPVRAEPTQRVTHLTYAVRER